MISDSDPVRKDDETPETSQESNNQTTQPNPDVFVGSSIPSAPPPKTHCEITYKHEKDKWEKFKEGAEVFGIFLLLVYTFYTIKMYCANKQAADAALSAANTAQKTLTQSVENFRIDERAWIEIGKIEKIAHPPPPPQFGKIFKFGIYPKNVGKTVATNVRAHIDNTRGSISFNSDEKAIRATQDQTWRDANTGNRIATPDNPGPQSIAPGDLSVVPLFAGGEEPKGSGNSLRYTYILGRFDYWDAFSVEHWKRFCFVIYDADGNLENCQYGNDEDPNLEIPPKR